MHHILAADPFESVLISRLLLTPINGSTRFYPDLFFILFMERQGQISPRSPTHTQARRPPSASALTLHGFVLMFTAGRLKGSRGVDTGGAPGWAGIPHVDVQSLENSLRSRPRGVMALTRRWPAERGRQLCFYWACLLKSHVCRLLLCLFLTC